MKNYNRRRRYRVNSEESESRRGWNFDPAWEHQLEEFGELEWNHPGGQDLEGKLTSLERPLIPRSPCGGKNGEMTSSERLTSRSSLPANHGTRQIFFTKPRDQWSEPEPHFDTFPDQDL